MYFHIHNTIRIYSIYLFLILLSFSACKPEEPSPRNYPRVRTISLGSLDSTGLTITGEIFDLGSSPIKDHGFMWSDNQNKDINESDTFSLGSTDQTGTFTQHIPQSRLRPGKRYIIRSYLISDKHTVIGNYIPFKAAGEILPTITKIKPDTGMVDDTVTVYTENITMTLSSVYIYFGDRKSRKINTSKDSLIVIVPPGLPKDPVGVSFYSQSNQPDPSSVKFTSLVPEIESFSPSQGTFYDRVEIIGKNFHPRAERNIVRFGDQDVRVSRATRTSLQVYVPVETSTSSPKISVQIEAQIGTSPQDFQLAPPLINSLSQEAGGINTLIELKGENFNPLLYHTQVWFGNTAVSINSGDETAIQVRVPLQPYVNRVHPIILEVSGMRVQSSKDFRISSSFIPRAELPNQQTQHGRNLAISFSLNGEAYLGLGGPRSVAGVKEWKDLWKFDPNTLNWTQLADYPGLGTFGASSFSIGNLGYVGVGQPINRGNELGEFYAYDPSMDQWTSRATFPGPLRNFDASKGFAIGNKGYIITQGNNVQNFWEYNAQSDSWAAKTSLPFPANDTRADVAVSLNSKGYVITGSDGNDRIWEYDPNTDSWTPKAPLPLSWPQKEGFVFEDKIFVMYPIARPDGKGQYFYQYEESTDIWIDVSEKLAPGLVLATPFSAGNKMFFAGGTYGFIANKYLWEFERNP